MVDRDLRCCKNR